MGKKRGARFYDAIYSLSGSYDGPIERLPWFELYCGAAAWVAAQNLNVLELGSGTGWLASFVANLSEERLSSYVGLDFSRVAIKCAAERVRDRRFIFLRRDLDKARLRFASGRAIVASELLEHLGKDRELLSKLPGGSPLWFSVARFDARGHVRHFEHQRDVVERYGRLLAALHIVEREKFFVCTAVVPRRARTGRS